MKKAVIAVVVLIAIVAGAYAGISRYRARQQQIVVAHRSSVPSFNIVQAPAS